MPEAAEGEITKEYTSKAPFSAEILVRQESHELLVMKGSGYNSKLINVDGGILLKITLSAQTLPALQEKIAGHVALIE